MDGRSKIRNFLLRSIRNQDLRDDEDIFEGRYVNSMFAMELVMFLESAFGIRVENEDLDLTNFKSVDSMSELVNRKTRKAPSA